MQITVLKHRTEAAIKTLNKIAKKSAKFGLEVPAWTVVDGGFIEVKHGKFVEEYAVDLITIEGIEVAPVVSGYTLVGRIDFHGEGNMVMACEALPEAFRTTDHRCDHCNNYRRRSSVFVIRDEEGNYTQVGRSCLQDFLSTRTIEDITYKFQALRDIAAMDYQSQNGDGEFFGGGGYAIPSVNTFLSIVRAIVDTHGWVSKAASQMSEGERPATINVYGGFMASNDRNAKFPEVAARLAEVTEADIQPMLDFAETLEGDYGHNIRTIIKMGYVEPRYQSLLASLVGVHDRGIAKLAERAAKAAAKATEPEPKHIGKVGEKIVGLKATLVAVQIIEGRYGYIHIAKFITEEGDKVEWFATNAIEAEVGTALAINATVKAHDVYRDERITKITRAKLVA